VTGWERADKISDLIVDLVNQQIKAGTSPVDVLAGQLLGLMALMLTAPLEVTPPSLLDLQIQIRATLRDMLTQWPRGTQDASSGSRDSSPEATEK
jgi:hypothetical protein